MTIKETNVGSSKPTSFPGSLQEQEAGTLEKNLLYFPLTTPTKKHVSRYTLVVIL